jgi:hypothetical protein
LFDEGKMANAVADPHGSGAELHPEVGRSGARRLFDVAASQHTHTGYFTVASRR